MAQIVTVFLSSVAAGLKDYRENVYRAIEGLEGYHCVRMEDFGARDALSVDLCREKVVTCDMFVGILGHLYGSCPPGSDMSFTEIEYEAAQEASKSPLMFVAPEEAPIPANLIEPPEDREKQRLFRARVLSERQAVIFNPDASRTRGLELSTQVVQAIHNARSSLTTIEQQRTAEQLTTILLFHFASNHRGFDTGINITNASAPPFGTKEPQGGTCILHFYGQQSRFVHVTSAIMPGEQVIFTLSGGNPIQLVPSAPGFHGYIVADCRFPDAHGWALITNGFGGIPTFAGSYTAKVIPDRRKLGNS
ncbi:MAG: DUF4062 domain-containing protein [Bryobacterales bacterium]